MSILSKINPITAILDVLRKPFAKALGEVLVDKDKKKELQHAYDLAIVETAVFFEEQITRRHELDMQSDSWLSKNIRPMALAFLTAVFVIITFADGNVGQFKLDPAYIPVYQALLLLAYSFYFGGRSVEKGIKIVKGDEEKQLKQ